MDQLVRQPALFSKWPVTLPPSFFFCHFVFADLFSSVFFFSFFFSASSLVPKNGYQTQLLKKHKTSTSSSANLLPYADAAGHMPTYRSASCPCCPHPTGTGVSRISYFLYTTGQLVNILRPSCETNKLTHNPTQPQPNPHPQHFFDESSTN